jgi:hypothetical protein
VNVVAHGIDFDQMRVLVLEHARDVGVKLAAFLIAKELAATLRTEDEMHNDVGEGLGHGVFWLRKLYRAALVGQWCAKMCRPCRAWEICVGGVPGPSARAITWQAFGPLRLAAETPMTFLIAAPEARYFRSPDRKA